MAIPIRKVLLYPDSVVYSVAMCRSNLWNLPLPYKLTTFPVPWTTSDLHVSVVVCGLRSILRVLYRHCCTQWMYACVHLFFISHFNAFWIGYKVRMFSTSFSWQPYVLGSRCRCFATDCLLTGGAQSRSTWLQLVSDIQSQDGAFYGYQSSIITPMVNHISCSLWPHVIVVVCGLGSVIRIAI